MKNYIILSAAICLIACTEKKSEPIKAQNEVIADSITKSDTITKTLLPKQTDSKLLIVPGTSIGLTALGQNAESLAVLGQPDLSDAAMGKAWMSWYSKKTDDKGFKSELMICTGYKDSEMKEKVIKEIRINSPDFKTGNGNGSGQTLETIQHEFPNLKLVSAYNNTALKTEVQIYDEVNDGIAFEIQQHGKCIAVIVHPKQKPLSNEYIVLHPELTRL